MSVIEFFLQAAIDWTRDILVGVLGRHAEEFIGKYVKRVRRRRKLLRRKGGRGTETGGKSKK